LVTRHYNARVNRVLPSLKWLRGAGLVLAVTLLSVHTASAAVKAAPDLPVIDEQPIGRIATAGGPVILSVKATSTSPLYYQWFTNNHTQPITNSARVTGATNAVLNIDPALTTDSGGYSVVVSSSGGSTTSLVASVTVNSLLAQPTVTGATGVIVLLTGQIGDVYRMELNENFTGYKTNGYATNINGSVSYTYRWPNDGLFRLRRETVDRVLPVMYTTGRQTPTTVRAYGKLNQAWRFEISSDFLEWSPIQTITNTTGWVQFDDPQLTPPPLRFYRISPP
jgi:hypothetical protein